MATGGAVRGALRATVRVDRSKVAGGSALRYACGVAVPLVVGLATGRALLGVAAAGGALSVGFASFQGVYRTRVAAMLAATLGMAVSTYVGAYAGRVEVTDVLVTGIWGFGAGMVVAAGPAASVVGLQWVIALLIVGQFPASADESVLRAVLVAAGGLAQTLLVVAVWPLRRFPAERSALAAAYRTLADYAGALPDAGGRPPDSGVLADARRILADPQPLGRRGQADAYRELLEQAERIRIRVAALARDHDRLRVAGAGVSLAMVEQAGSAVARVLARVATALPARRPPAAGTAELNELRHLADGFAGPGARSRPVVVAALDAVADVRALADALDGVLRSADEAVGGIGTSTARSSSARPPVLPVRDAVSTLRANLTLQSAACRHAVRLAVSLAIATALYRLLPVPRGYWLPLTVLVVLKPDFAATAHRGVARIAGTLLGAGLATLIAAMLRPGPAALAALVVVLCWAGAAVLLVNYALFATCITGVVVFLVAFAGLPEVTAVADRTIDTVLGGAVALLAYAVWPTWEAGAVRERLAGLLDALGGYALAVLDGYVDAGPNRAALRETRPAARLARTNAEASVQRMLGEPERAWRIAPDVALGILAEGRRFVLAALTLQAHLADLTLATAGARSSSLGGAPTGALGVFRDQLGTAMRALGAAVCTGDRAGLPPLRETHAALAAEHLSTGAQGTSTVLAEASLLIDSVEGIAQLLAAPPLARGGR